jgi:competence ComEA-like helix-hairpin-helix protein
VNTASPALLTYVAGIGPKLAEKIVTHRDQHGVFSAREELRKVSGLGPRAFEQSAGFLRIRNGRNPLDASAIHPESMHWPRQCWQAEPAMRRPSRKAGKTQAHLPGKRRLNGLRGTTGRYLRSARPTWETRQGAAPILRSRLEDGRPGSRW